MAQRTLFIINPAAGAGRAESRWPRFRRLFRRHDKHEDQIVTDRPGAALQIAQESAHKYELVVAVGGDGTVLEVAGGILSSAAKRTALGIVPLGTGNDFARNSGIHNEENAHDALTQGQTRFVDVIETRCIVEERPVVRHALLFAGVGIIGEALKQTTTPVKRLFGQRLAYPVGI